MKQLKEIIVFSTSIALIGTFISCSWIFVSVEIINTAEQRTERRVSSSSSLSAAHPSTVSQEQVQIRPESASRENYPHSLPQVSHHSRRDPRPPPSPPPSYSVRCPPSALVTNRFDDVSTSSEESDDEIHRRATRLRGAYCPDLLHACSLIIPSNQQQDHTFQGAPTTTTSTTSFSHDSSDYIEIDELCNNFSQISGNNNARQQPPSSALKQEEGCIANSREQAMGQTISLRRPRISLTWVLREQQPQQNGTNSTESKPPTDKKKFKTKNKDEKLFNEKYVSNHNLQDYQEKREPSKDLLFVCTPQKQSLETVQCDAFTKRRTDARRTFERKSLKASECVLDNKNENSNEECKSLKGTYSEPSLIAASEGNQRRHRHRKRRDRNRMQKFGYEIRNVDEFLSKCSLASPGNIPVVLSSSSTLYQTRPGGYQIEVPLPLGMVVNAVFKNQNWLYVQTPHAEEGYVGYASCLPLGILPPAARTTSTSRPPPCWETNVDIFPRPCGNMTDSEKEIRLRGGTRSDGARTPRPRRISTTKSYGEHHVDKLYLRAASQPKLTEKSYAQLKQTVNYSNKHQEQLSSCNGKPNDEYVLLQHKSKLVQQQRQYPNMGTKTRSLRQTLVAITNDYATDAIIVRKGDIVTLLDCRESKEKRQWFYIKNREGREGFIPAEVAGHGFL